MLSLLLRSLGLVALFEILGLAVVAAAPGRRNVMVLVMLAAIAATATALHSLDPALMLASAVVAGWAIAAVTRRSAGVWPTVAVGMIPVILAASLELAGVDPHVSWSELHAQVEELAGIGLKPPSTEAESTPEEQQLADRTQALARTASTWALRLVPMELVAMALLQVLPLVAFSGAWARRRGFPVGVPPLASWQVPFASVWMLAAGLALVATRQHTAVVVGANVVGVAALWFAVQGFAVGLTAFGRRGQRLLRGLLLLLAALLAWPFVLSALALLGAMDLWVDFRRLRQAADES
jgi:Predicted membrane protein (DUF2232)